MESQPQNPEFRNNPQNFHPCIHRVNNGTGKTGKTGWSVSSFFVHATKSGFHAINYNSNALAFVVGYLIG